MDQNDLSFYMLIAIISMAISMAITPVMLRLAPVIGMVDRPDNRKIHTESIPRSGGVGIVIGLLVPMLIWLDLDRFIISLLIGCTVLLLFGAWDDTQNVRPIYKFVGQIIAAVVIVYYGDIYVSHFPFTGIETLPSFIGKPFTVVAIIGMINALNLSDGLDGLAGGEALISLAGLSFLAYQFQGETALMITAATIGGIFGFLRFNSHPARIFMGDAGSQTLGYILGVMVVYLSQQVNPVVSPVIALMLLGLPVIDSLIVFYLRAKRGDSLVVAAKDHLHHRLLGLGFYHYESVMIIYSVQSLFVAVAAIMPYESDTLLITIYMGISILLYSFVTIAEKKSWKAHLGGATKLRYLSGFIVQHRIVSIIPARVVEAGLSVFLIGSALMVTSVPVDIGLSSLLLLGLFGVVVSTGWLGMSFYRLTIFVTAGSSVYLMAEYPPSWLFEQIYLVYVFYALMTIAAFVMARLSMTDQFKITPLDYLVVIIALAVANAPGVDTGSTSVTWMAIQMIILFYSAELLIQRLDGYRNRLSGVVLISLLLVGIRGIA